MSANKVASFPEFIKQLPQGDYSSDGGEDIRGYVVQGPGHQVVFNENDDPIEFTPHTHAASFGVVLQGWCELVIEGVSTIYRAGEMYQVPAGKLHFARQSAGYKDIVIFNEPNRVPT
jgi:mannose-6-phosphate isomerase-like protein (cupin superfamily)